MYYFSIVVSMEFISHSYISNQNINILVTIYRVIKNIYNLFKMCKTICLLSFSNGLNEHIKINYCVLQNTQKIKVF